VDGFLTDVELETTSNILFLHGMLRIKPDVNFFVQPYFDGLIGYKVLYTRTKLVDLLADEDRVLESETNQSDWAFSYGGAIGVQIDLSRRKNIYLDLRCAYLPGASAQYLVRREDTGQVFDEPIEAFEEKSSPTAVLLPQIGVTFEFWKFTE
jgi:opacity protein-like surface antigen